MRRRTVAFSVLFKSASSGTSFDPPEMRDDLATHLLKEDLLHLFPRSPQRDILKILLGEHEQFGNLKELELSKSFAAHSTIFKEVKRMRAKLKSHLLN
jgi:hypothetical protein